MEKSPKKFYNPKADVRAKLAIVMGFSTIGVFVQHLYVLAFILLLSVIAAFIFKAELYKALRSTKNLWYIFLIIVVLQSIFIHSGRIFLQIGSFPVLTMGGILKGGEFLLRVAIIVFSATIVSTSNSREVVQGLIQMKIPYDIAFMVSVAIRFLPLLRNEIKDTFTAIQLRGIEIKKIPLKKRIRLYLYVFNPVVAGAIRKAHQLSVAMEMRAFRAYKGRTSLLHLKFCAADYFIMISMLLFTAAVFVIYYYLGFPKSII